MHATRENPLRQHASLLALTSTMLALLAIVFLRSRSGTSIDLDAPRQAKALADVALLAATARLFEKNNGRIPSIDELLEAEPADSPLRDLAEDPWGNAYEIEGMTVTRCEVISAGPDGEFDTGDDVRSRRGDDR